MADVALTTTNNPWNPFTQFDRWYAFDCSHGYGCCEYLDRVFPTSDDIVGEDAEIYLENAIDEIVSLSIPLEENVYFKKVYRNSFKNDETKSD